MMTPEEYVHRHRLPLRDEAVAEARLTRSRRVGMVRVTHGGIPFSDPAGDTYLLTAPIHGAPYVECDFAGFAIRQRTYPGDFIVQHLKDGVSGFADGAVTVQIAAIDGPWLRQLAGEALDGAAPDWERAAVRSWRNDFLSGLLDRLWSRLDDGGDGGQAWVDQASILAVQTLAERLAPAARKPADASPLPAAQMRRVHDFIEAHFGEAIGVAELAAAANLSPYHFSRRFKAAMGVSPHRFLIRRRLDHARRMIAEGALPLSAIAPLCGFSSQAHMTTAFRAHFGRTPGWFVRHR